MQVQHASIIGLFSEMLAANWMQWSNRQLKRTGEGRQQDFGSRGRLGSRTECPLVPCPPQIAWEPRGFPSRSWLCQVAGLESKAPYSGSWKEDWHMKESNQWAEPARLEGTLAGKRAKWLPDDDNKAGGQAEAPVMVKSCQNLEARAQSIVSHRGSWRSEPCWSVEGINCSFP